MRWQEQEGKDVLCVRDSRSWRNTSNVEDETLKDMGRKRERKEKRHAKKKY